MSPDIVALRWGLVAQDLIRVRDGLLWMAKPHEENCRYDTPEQKDCFRRAARALGPSITEAVNHRNEHESRKQKERDARTLPPQDMPTPQEFGRMGVEAAGKALTEMTNLEMSACLANDREQKYAAIERDGCCGGEPMADGICTGIGKCPRFFEAERCVAFVSRYLEWLEQINESKALAAVAARLSVGSPIELELQDVRKRDDDGGSKTKCRSASRESGR